MKELTPSELIQYYCLYNQSKVVCDGRIKCIVGFDLPRHRISISFEGFFHCEEVHPFHCKLILRPFEDMTKEEKNQIYSIIKTNPNRNISDKGVFWFLDSDIPIEQLSQTLSYLRSISIDCDNLIGAGYAVREEAKP